MVALFIVIGYGVANVYFVARTDIKPNAALGTSLGVAMAISCVAMPFYWGVGTALQDSVLGGLPTIFIGLGALMIPGLLVVRYTSAVAQGLQKASVMNTITMTQTLATLVGYVVLLVVYDLGPTAAFSSIVAATFIASIPAIAWIWREHGRPMFDRAYASKGMRFGFRGELSNVITFFGYRLDLLLLSAFASFDAVGYYVVAFTLAELLWLLPNALAAVIFPLVAASSEAGSRGVPLLARATLWITVVLAAIGAIVAVPLVPLIFSAPFEASIQPLHLLIPGVLLFGAGKLLTAALAGFGKPGVATAANAVGLVVMVVLDIALVPRWSASGAAIASSVAYATVFILQATVFLRTTQNRWSDLLIPRRGDLRGAWDLARADLASFQRGPA
jgi:O-antigen/teichoic acid export membrane protein